MRQRRVQNRGVVRKVGEYKGNEVSRAKNGRAIREDAGGRKGRKEERGKEEIARGVSASGRGDPVLGDNGIPFSSRSSALTRVVYPSKISKIKPNTTERTLDFNQRRSCLLVLFSPRDPPPPPLVERSVN